MADASKGSARVFQQREAHWIQRSPGVRAIHLVSKAMGSLELLNGLTEIAVNQAVPLHFHNCEESVLVLSGVARLELEKGSYELSPGDVAWTPMGEIHRYVNAGDRPLRIFWTYGSASATRTLVDSGETRAIASELGEVIREPDAERTFDQP